MNVRIGLTNDVQCIYCCKRTLLLKKKAPLIDPVGHSVRLEDIPEKRELKSISNIHFIQTYNHQQLNRLPAPCILWWEY